MTANLDQPSPQPAPAPQPDGNAPDRFVYDPQDQRPAWPHGDGDSAAPQESRQDGNRVGAASDTSTEAAEPRERGSSEQRGLHGSQMGTNVARAGLAEAVGTFFLVFTGTAVAAAGALNHAVAGQAYDSLAVALAFGLVLAALAGALGHVSGGHFNPAVTLGLAVNRRFPWRVVPAYLACQLAGAVLAGCATWLTVGGAARSTAHLGATGPAAGVGAGRAFVVEALITFLLVFVIVAVSTDDRVHPAAASTCIGFALAAAVLIGGPTTGGAVNPVRALGPQLVAGYFADWWVYLLAPVVGGIAATALYSLVVRHTEPPSTEG